MQSLPHPISKLFGVMFFLAVISLGAVLVFGTAQRWRWLVDPPEDYWFFYSQAFIKKFFGARAVVSFTYVIGFAFIVVGIFVLVKGLGFLDQ